jgi:hypothetical protein
MFFFGPNAQEAVQRFLVVLDGTEFTEKDGTVTTVLRHHGRLTLVVNGVAQVWAVDKDGNIECKDDNADFALLTQVEGLSNEVLSQFTETMPLFTMMPTKDGTKGSWQGLVF